MKIFFIILYYLKCQRVSIDFYCVEFAEFDKFLGFYVNLGLIIIEFGLEKKVKMLWLN